MVLGSLEKEFIRYGMRHDPPLTVKDLVQSMVLARLAGQDNPQEAASPYVVQDTFDLITDATEEFIRQERQ